MQFYAFNLFVREKLLSSPVYHDWDKQNIQSEIYKI